MRNDNRIKTRRLSIEKKILFGGLLIGFSICILIGTVVYSMTSKQLLSTIKTNAMSIATIAGVKIDGDIHDTILPGEEKSTNYQSIANNLNDFKNDSNIIFIYTMKLLDQTNVQFVVDTDETSKKSLIGDTYERYDKINEALSGKAVIDDTPTTDDWGPQYSAFAPIYNSSQEVVGIVGIDYAVSTINDQMALLLRLIVSISSICVGITVLGVIILSRKIGKNLRIVNQKVIDVVHSDGDLTKTIDIHSGDELEVIATNLNEFLDHTRQIILKIRTASTKILMSSDFINVSMIQSTSKISDVASTMQEMSASMEQTSSSMENMYQFSEVSYKSFEEINGNISHGSDLVLDISKKASSLMKAATLAQENTKRKVFEINDSLHEKIEQSKAVIRINELTDNILRISKQTNLLALNANIEAARAGEEGKGFAVVASQIGVLAENSSQTATQIQNISKFVIQAVNELALVASDMIEYINGTIMDDYKKMVYMGDQYHADSESINQLITGFKDEVTNLYDAMNHIRESIQTVTEIVEESTKEIQIVSANTFDINSNVQDVGQKVLENSTSAKNLENVVGHFKV